MLSGKAEALNDENQNHFLLHGDESARITSEAKVV
jgi:hypothetical protein